MTSSQLVYSTETGGTCPKCTRSLKKCQCASGQQLAKGDGVARIRRETKGRNGKAVTTITGVPCSNSDLVFLASELKKKCSCGGSVKDGVIVIQGDHRELCAQVLKDKGYSAKLAGG